MKNKTICFCIRGIKQKSEEHEQRDVEKFTERKASHPKHRRKGKSRGFASKTTGDDVDGNFRGGATTVSNEAGVAVAVDTLRDKFKC